MVSIVNFLLCFFKEWQLFRFNQLTIEHIIKSNRLFTPSLLSLRHCHADCALPPRLFMMDRGYWVSLLYAVDLSFLGPAQKSQL